MAKTYGFNIAGGDIIQSEKSIISVFLVGKYGSKRIICRSGAKKGDILMVSGPLGLSALGLNIMKNQLKSALKHDPTFGGTVDLDEKKLIYTHLFPEPKLKEGKILANDDILATSLMDTSDDLMSSLEILAQESRVGFEVNLEKAPLSPLLISVSQKMGCSPYEFFLYGGEDYQLLFTVLPRKAALVKKKIPSAYVIGEVKSRSFGIQIKMQGNPFRIKDTRFRHF